MISKPYEGRRAMATTYSHSREDSVGIHVLARYALDELAGVDVGVLALINVAVRE